ncbi:hypothetical protein T459_22557 [Capsicum annuum]|uniref:Uncharacterized protein n=1 Tax=Capsicum annuum TaxID=4072 RepID=A0A2G2YPU4_CAPAN|nr:hypothetical protein T459_22557 [Capsicum annuum]
MKLIQRVLWAANAFKLRSSDHHQAFKNFSTLPNFGSKQRSAEERPFLTETMTNGKQGSSGSSRVKNPVAAEHVHTSGTVTPGVVVAVLQNDDVGVKLMDPKLGVGGSKLTEADP